MTATYVITLVHGTWVGRRRPKWACPSSTLRRAIIHELGEATVIFQRIRWRGWNRQSDRRQAALRLERRLLLGFKQHPGAQHYVLAHSHGGTLVKYALSREVQERLAGVICLGSPFVHASPRDPKTLTQHLNWALAVASGSVGLLLATVLVFGLHALLYGAREPGGFLSLIWLVVWAACSLFGFRVLAPLTVARMERAFERVNVSVGMTATVRTPYLCVSLEDDEAQGVLGAASALSAVPFRIEARLSEFVRETGPTVLHLVWMLGMPLMLLGNWVRAAVLLAVGAALFLGPTVVWPAMLVAPRLPSMFLGLLPEVRLLDCLFVQVYSANAPEYAENAYQVTYAHDLAFDGESAPSRSTWFSLSHCLIYESCQIARGVAAWMRGGRDELDRQIAASGGQLHATDESSGSGAFSGQAESSVPRPLSSGAIRRGQSSAGATEELSQSAEESNGGLWDNPVFLFLLGGLVWSALIYLVGNTVSPGFMALFGPAFWGVFVSAGGAVVVFNRLR